MPDPQDSLRLPAPRSQRETLPSIYTQIKTIRFLGTSHRIFMRWRILLKFSEKRHISLAPSPVQPYTASASRIPVHYGERMKLAALLSLALAIALGTWSATDYFQNHHYDTILGSIGLLALITSLTLFSKITKQGIGR
jgi:hypothetical protein